MAFTGIRIHVSFYHFGVWGKDLWAKSTFRYWRATSIKKFFFPTFVSTNLTRYCITQIHREKKLVIQVDAPDGRDFVDGLINVPFFFKGTGMVIEGG